VAKLLSVVEGAFQLSGQHSVVVVPGIPREGDWQLKPGDPLTLLLPDGSKVETVIGGFEMASPPNPTSIALMLGPGLTKEAVPIGTEIWVD
jgi:hypothetical protein